MTDRCCDVLVVGGGVGGCAAALAACDLGCSVVMTEPCAWIGGQLTSQAVPPDEHPWIEQFGCTRTYRAFRDGVRAWYRTHRKLAPEAASDPRLNPGKGWVSRLCHEPRVSVDVLEAKIAPHVASGRLEILRGWEPTGAETEGDRVRSVTLREIASGARRTVAAPFVLDATETGDLLPLAGVEYVLGAESQRETGEPHGVPGDPEPDDVQGLTWCFAMGFDPDGEHVAERPASYEFWRSYKPDFWPGPLLGWDTIHAHTMRPHTWTLFGKDAPSGLGLFEYRRIVCGEVFQPPRPHDATVVNWPQNDYLLGSILDEPAEVVEKRLRESRELSICLLYWLQTEAERPDGGRGWPGLYLDGALTGTEDGFAMAPYIRESRRIRARFTVLEQHVAAECNPGKNKADSFPDSVGIGCYRIDLHPSTNGKNTIDIPALPFEIPLGALVPVRVENLLPACKNIGTTHITNGCYRLHPVEWNIGEAAGSLAAFALSRSTTPQGVCENPALLADFQNLLESRGVELHWPDSVHPV